MEEFMNIRIDSHTFRAKLIIDIALTFGFLSSFILGEPVAKSQQASNSIIHALLSIATTALLVWHILHHRSWFMSKLFSGVTFAIPWSPRGFVPLLLGVSFLLTVISGVLCLRIIIGMEPSPTVIGLHHLSPKIALISTIWHLVLCRHQIVHLANRCRLQVSSIK